jgi:hypothetical protein
LGTTGSIQRLYGVLIAGADNDARVSAAMLSRAIAVGVMHPLVADIDDETLRSQLRRITRRLIDAVETDHDSASGGNIGADSQKG